MRLRDDTCVLSAPRATGYTIKPTIKLIGAIKFWFISVLPVSPASSLPVLVTKGKYGSQCRDLVELVWNISKVGWGSQELKGPGQGLL